MLSFLPKKHKQHLLNEYRLKLVIVCLNAISVLCVIALVGLLPSYLNEKAQADALRPQIAKESTAEEKEIMARRQANQVLAEYLAKEIRVFNAKSAPSDLVREIIEDKPSSVSLQAIRLGEKTISMSGIADTRNDLIVFQRTLQNNPLFAEVNLPISDITKNVDAPFTIDVSLK